MQAHNCGLPDGVLERLQVVFADYPEVQTVRLFGSRAKGNFRSGSDIDFCLEAPSLSATRRLQLETRIDDLLLPWRVDVVLDHEIDLPALREHIQRVGLPLDSLLR